MKKKMLSLLLTATMAAGMLAGCGSSDTAATETKTEAKSDTATTDSEETEQGKIVNIYCWNDEFKTRYEKYAADLAEKHGVEVNFVIVATENNAYQNNLDAALMAQETAPADEKVDIFLVEADYATKYTKSQFSLDIVNDIGLAEEDLAGQYQYTKDIVTVDGAQKGTAWQATPGLFAYRRSIAKEVLGTDDPVEVQAALSDWDNFDATAAKMKDAGYFMLSGYDDSYRAFSNNVSAPWVDGTKIVIDESILNWIEQTKTYTDTMTENSDANGRLEFNMGNQGSTAGVYITNVRVEKTGEIDVLTSEKSILPDGNFIYNGSFQEGADRLAYWTVESQCTDAEVSVTNIDNIRELKVIVPDTVAALEEVIVKQTPVKIAGGKKYIFSFDAYADSAKTIQTQIAGQTFDCELTTEKESYKYILETDEALTESEVMFMLGVPGDTYIDNVRVQEDAMLMNGDFSNGMTGYEVYAYTASDVSYVIDSLNENHAFSIDIFNTGDADWKIQLKQNNITLESGKTYKLSMDVKSTMNRKIMYALQRDGSADDDWTPYSGSQVIELTQDYQNFSTTFEMAYDTDEAVILSISMGAVEGIGISDKHSVVIDNVSLEEVK